MEIEKPKFFDKYPNIREFDPLKQILWILEIGLKEDIGDRMSSEQISKALWRAYRVDMKPRRITNILNASRGKVKITTDNEKTYYSINSNGESLIFGYEKAEKQSIKLFNELLTKKLEEKFKSELKELNICYFNGCGDSTAFLLRKILEKAIYLAFAKNQKLDKLKDPKDSSKFIGLKNMISMASSEMSKDGTPFLSPKTASELKGIKFLCDTAAHSFLYNIHIDDIKHEFSILIVALGELSKKL